MYIRTLKYHKLMSVNKKNKAAFAPLFDKSNYILMGVGLLVVVLGFILMSGGKSEDPNVFLSDELYSFRRITLAPILVISGFVIEIIAIFKLPKSQK